MEDRPNNYAFIDSQNVNLSIQAQGWKLDFQRFRVYLRDKYSVKQAFLFIGYLPANQPLYNNLQQMGYIIVFKPTLIYGNGKIKGNVDAELVLHTMIEYPNYYKAIIVTGDGDFYCLVDYLYKQDKLLRLLIPNADKYSCLLKPFAPNAIDFMNNLRKKMAYQKPSEMNQRA